MQRVSSAVPARLIKTDRLLRERVIAAWPEPEDEENDETREAEE